MKTVALISADEEWRAVQRLFPHAIEQRALMGPLLNVRLEGRDVVLFHGGWGKISAAATTQFVLDQFAPDLLVNLGTCGGLEGRIDRDMIALVERTIVYDIMELMGDGEAAIQHYSSELDLSWLPAELPTPVWRGLMLSADRDILASDVRGLIERYGAVVGDWESGAIAWVAKRNEAKCLILRGVTDLVGEGGGEAYGPGDFFASRTAEVMEALFGILPTWLQAIEGKAEWLSPSQAKLNPDIGR